MRLHIPLRQNKTHYKNYLLLLLICLLAYWPISFGIFSVKNDAIHYFLPYRFQISETLRNGEWPFWNPYIYLGYPVHGDMQSGAWNPIVWFFSLFSRYNITLFHFENLLYIFVGGAGMYKLTNRLTDHTHTALLIAASYMLSGFVLGGQLINWLAAAAFLPFVIHYYLQTLRLPLFSNAIKTGIALYFLFVAGYPSFFIITGYILLALFTIAIINRLRSGGKAAIPHKRFALQHLLIAVIFTGLALPAIVSFIELLPYYDRGSGAVYTDVIHNSFELQHLLSFIFPSAIKANDLVSATDVTCRNLYIGIFPLIILSAFPPKLSSRNILLTLLAVFALLFSLGDATPIRKLCYKFIPFMDTFRHPSQMRLFFLFAILLLAAPGLKKLLSNDYPAVNIKRIKQFTLAFTILLFIITVISFFQSGILKTIINTKFSEIRIGLKNVFDKTTISDAIALNGLIQLAFLVSFLLLLKRNHVNKKKFCSLWVINLFIMAQLVLPATFVSKTSPKEINRIINSSPKGFPVDGLEKSIAENSKDATAGFDKIALAYFYNKRIGISHITNSPSFLATQEKFIQTSFLYNYVASLPVVYISDSMVSLKDTALIRIATENKYAFTEDLVIHAQKKSVGSSSEAVIKKLSANRFEIETQTESASFLVLTQNYHHHWKVKLDGNPALIYKTNISFMSTPLPAGRHTISFQYRPGNTILAMWAQLTTVILLIITGTVSLIRQNSLSRQ